MQIGSLKLDNPVFSAPMAGISDLPYRLIMKRHGAALVYTEMISANGLFFNGQATRELLRSDPEERPMAIQLFGENPERIAEAAREIEADGDLLDINMGCPVRKVIRAGSGSALLQQPEQIARIVKTVRNTTTKPLTIKIRSGWDHESINYLEIGKIAEDNGADAITLHPRTRTQMFGGEADWNHIKELKQQLTIPVIGSGDLFSAEKIKTMFELTGCDAVMVGRGGYGNPWIITQALDLLAGKTPEDPTPDQRYGVAREHFRLSLELYGPQKTSGLMRKHLCWYARGMEGAASFRAEINRTKTIDEMNATLEEFFANAAKEH